VRRREETVSLAALVIRGSLFRGAQSVVQGVVSFLVIPFIIHALGNRLYGFWEIIGGAIGLYGFVDLGLPTAVTRFVSRAIGRGDDDEANATVSLSLAIFLGISAAVGLLTLLAAFLTPLLLERPDEAALFGRVILIMGAGLVIEIPTRAFKGLLIARLRYDIVQTLTMARLVASAGLVFLFLGAGYGLPALAAITAGTKALEGLGRVAAALRVCPGLRLGRAGCTRARALQLLDYSGKALLAEAADIVRFRVDALVIAVALRLEAVTFYSVGQRVLNYLRDAVQNTLTVMIPVYSRIDGQGDEERLRRTFLGVSRVAFTLAIFTGSLALFYGRDFINRWMGPAYADSYLVLVILGLPMMLELAQNPAIQLLYGISRQHYYAWLNLAEAAVNLVLSLILVRRWGIYGVAWGTAIEILLFKGLVLPLIVCRQVGIPPMRYYREVLGGTFLRAAIPLGLFFAAAASWRTDDYGRLALLVGLQALFFAPLAYFLILTGEERSVLRAIVRRAAPAPPSSGAKGPP
jgi:O-antigen/teichoic acid export membrane protein